MSEIKHTFQAGKMNKDLDERLVPNGEYRDALNIEVRTSSGNDGGAVQVLSGNTLISELSHAGVMDATKSWSGDLSSFVGSVADEKNNKAYFFIASPPVGQLVMSDITSTKVFKDMIIEYNATTKNIKPVVVDIFTVHLTASDLGTTSQGNVVGYNSITVTDDEKRGLIRPGMTVQAYSSSGAITNMITSKHGDSGIPTVRQVSGDEVIFDMELEGSLTDADVWIFQAEPTLCFHNATVDSKKLITGINIIDNLLFWTDNRWEPKKINIDRCVAGTPKFSEHSKLFITNPESRGGLLASIDNIDHGTDNALKREHITVIKRAPRSAPKLEMSVSPRDNTTGTIASQSFVLDANVYDTAGDLIGTAGDPFEAGHLVGGVNILNANYQPEDVLILDNTTGSDVITIRAKVVAAGINNNYELKILSSDTSITSSNLIWQVRLELDRPLFELKFGRFSYRYKYEDGEYSSFAPWSELAFLPGTFDYVPLKGYNLGMVNNIRELKVTDFIVDDDLRPDDVVAVDVLYKDTVSPNVYIVKTVKRGRHPEWNDNATAGSGDSGVLNITSEMIHNALPSSQTLRAWDNVPRKALAQEVTGNRIVYGNYLQNYDIKQPVVINQGLIEVAHPSDLSPKKSIKSIRKYKIGIVFGDKYGRETPVMGMGGLRDMSTDIKSTESGILRADVYNPKKNAHKITKLSAKQQWGISNTAASKPSSWMEYFKYYIKETTNEYYNMAMDRWYDAEDGNIWLSFQSSDRNKVDEDTYLVLKNQHGGEEPVLEEARYKILAIENEAPDYIKITEKILGESRITDGDDNDLDGIPTSSVVIFQSDTASLAWSQVFEGIKFEGTGYARIKGIYNSEQAYSKWVKIARINDAAKSIITVEPFGDSADMQDLLGSADAEYYLQVRDNVVENKPEFDGRFFVKIYKDSTLVENVLIQTSDDVEYFKIATGKFAYISSTVNNPAQDSNSITPGLYTDTDWNTGGGDTFTNSDIDEMGTCSGNLQSKIRRAKNTIAFWKNHNWMGFKSGATWFLDDARLWKEKGYGERKGLHSRPGVGGKSAMDFSVRDNHFPTDGPNADFKQRMTTPGTFFKFRNDPNDVVYQVKSTKNKNPKGLNSTKRQVSGSCQECDFDLDKKAWCRRYTFGVYFTRANDSTMGVDVGDWDPRGELKHTGQSSANIDFVAPNYTYSEDIRYTESNAIWETEPKEDVGLDLYYEATSALPIKLTQENNTSFAPKLSSVTCERPGKGTTFIANDPIVHSIVRDVVALRDSVSNAPFPFQVSINDILTFEHSNGTVTRSKVLDHYKELETYHSDYVPSTSFIISTTFDGSTTATIPSSVVGFDTIVTGRNWEVIPLSDTGVNPGTFVDGITGTSLSLNQAATHTGTVDTLFKEVTGYYKLDTNVYKYTTDLPWFNCYSFGNGLESDRIRDDYNAPTIDNGCKVSTILNDYGEERRGNGLIYSGIYNSTSGVNSLNEFNMAEKITKDLNPSYGSIQALKSRDTNLVTFCEDKVLQILANKDALYNADGSRNVTASSAVLGDARGFAGDYGISSNPESLAVDGYRMYFTDKQRGKVMRLSQDGLTPISDAGMSTWFRDNLRHTNELVGSFDEVKGEYNLSLKHKSGFVTYVGVVGSSADTTVSFSESSKGWVSFKSFVPQASLSINSEYLTANTGTVEDVDFAGVYVHHDTAVNNNTFYGEYFNSTIDVLFNDNPSSIKSFSSINYEGTKSRVLSTEGSPVVEPWRVNPTNGWYVSSFKTDKQDGYVPHFVEKEGKWFNYIFGEETTLSNLDPSEFTVQGLGVPTSITNNTQAKVTLTINNID